MKTLAKLVEQLERNTAALRQLNARYTRAKKNPFYDMLLYAENARNKDLDWIRKVTKRVLRMRYRLLENINGEVLKEMNSTSNMTRNLIPTHENA